MDIARPDLLLARQRRTWILRSAGLAVVAVAGIAFARLEPAAPAVPHSAVVIETVERGDMLREVRGPGSLVAVEEQWISAATEGRVERVVVRPGTPVEPDTVLLVLSNPELAQQALDEEAELNAAEADYRMREAQLASSLLDQQAAVEAADGESAEAALQLEANERLATEGLLPKLTLDLSRLRRDQLARRAALEHERLAQASTSNDAQLAAERSRLESQRALRELRRAQERGLEVVAGLRGVLQEVAVEPGQRVVIGATLAKVVRPDALKAELRIPEAQARDLVVGQAAVVDTRNGKVPGRVVRIDPAARQGTVTVDVELTGELPRGARPDLSVDGTITLERLGDVLHLARPAFGEAGSTVSLYRLVGDDEAVRVPVRLGRASAATVEIVDGLEVGDRVVVSRIDVDDAPRIRLQ